MHLNVLLYINGHFLYIKINRNYINTWNYSLPDSTDQLLNLDMSCVTDPPALLDKLIGFLDIDVTDERYTKALQFINDYVKINKYDCRQT